jgi:hypothetical protein
MTNPERATAGCLMVGEYVDEAECPANLAFHRGEVVRPQVVANFLDLWGCDDGLREFTVLLKDGRVIVVRGHGLKSELPRASVFSIVVRVGGEEVIVALFKSDDVSGIFHGELQPDRKSA